MKREVLGRISKEGDFIDFLSLLDECFNDLNAMRFTLPGHHGYGSTLAQTRVPTVSACWGAIQFQKVIRLINVFWKQSLSLNLI